MDYKGTPFADTMFEHLGIEMVEGTKDKVILSMPVGPKVHQPYGLLHGGASVVLAESAASVGTALNIDPETQWAVGMEINANHVSSVRDGVVTAVALPLHRGKHSMVWEVTIKNQDGKLVCISRTTVAVIPKRA